MDPPVAPSVGPRTTDLPILTPTRLPRRRSFARHTERQDCYVSTQGVVSLTGQRWAWGWWGVGMSPDRTTATFDGPRPVRASNDATDASALRMIDRCGTTYAVNIRLITLPPIVIVAVLAPDEPATRRSAVVAVVLVAIWSLGYVRLLRRQRVRLATALDAAVLCGLALGTIAVVPPLWLATGKSWLVPFVSFAAVGYQFSAATRDASAGAVAVSAAMFTGTVLALPAGSGTATMVTAAWSLVVSLLARLMWQLVRRGGHRADAALADVERARRDRAVADAIRADQQLFSSALHDTAATTLLMVGLRVADREMVAARASRDLTVLQRIDQGPAVVDLGGLLTDAVALVPIDVHLVVPDDLAISMDLARAVTGATTEAVSNAARHAEVSDVQVRVRTTGDVLSVEIVDHGIGFDPGSVGTARRGLRDSIIGRIERVGGTVRVRSTPGSGTVVEMLCPW